MSAKKVPGAPPTQVSKTPRQGSEVDAFRDQCPTWVIGSVDLHGSRWGWDKADWGDVVRVQQRLKALETRPWKEILNDRSNGQIDVDQLDPDAAKRLEELSRDDVPALVEALVSERIGQEVYLDEDGTTIDGDTGEVLSEPEEPPPSAPPARNGDIVLPPKAPPGARVRLLRVATEKKLGKTAVEAILAAAGTSWEGVDKASEAEVQALIAKIEEAALDNTKT